MGVPKFFRWLSERYPLINQRYHAPSPTYEHKLEQQQQHLSKEAEEAETKQGSNKNKNAKHNTSTTSTTTPLLSNPKDVLGSATLAPEVDRLYIDMNGIIHGCSHNNNGDDNDNGSAVTHISEEEIFDNISTYLDRIIGDIVRPKHVVYMAIDGVAPRAKLNQQRSRRYRSSSGQEIEQTVYEAHLNSIHQQQQSQQQYDAEEEYYNETQNDLIMEEEYYESDAVGAPMTMSSSSSSKSNSKNTHTHTSSDTGGQLLTEVEPGRFAGKFETQLSGEMGASTTSTSTSTSNSSSADAVQQQQQQRFHSNAITPGTPFFSRCVDHLEQFLRNRLANDPKWKDLTIIFSGPNVPGEGEHKIMDFMRTQKQRPDYDPNLRHCIMGQDGDLIMLGLVTHEPNLVLFREQVIFDGKRRQQMEGMGVKGYVHNPNFEFLHMNVLRDYLAFDFETSNVVANSPFDLERTIDDFVFMTFFVGNDFLPSIPALDIADEAFDLLWYTYREHREKWYEESKQETNGMLAPYLTHAGSIVSGKRLEAFLAEVGSFESPYYDNKKDSAQETNRRIRSADRKWGVETLPSDNVLQAKEEADRARFREMMLEKQQQEWNTTNTDDNHFTPVLSSPEPVQFEPSQRKEDERLEPGLPARLGNLLQKSFTPHPTSTTTNTNTTTDGSGGEEQTDDAMAMLDDQDLKGRYYFDKFQFTPFDKEKHQALRKAYIEGLVWNLKYYYEGVASWDWYYPYHYGPMLSDLKGIDDMLEEISFEGKLGEPLQPFEQLLSCMPPSQAHMLPEPYRWLMTSPSSPIIEYYPKAFTVDMNGKRWPWEAVVLLPFIDTQKLLKYSRRITEDYLSVDEVERNKESRAIVMSHDSVKSSKFQGENKSVGGAVEEDAVHIDPFEFSEWNYSTEGTIGFQPELRDELVAPLPGFPTLKSAPIRSLWRRRLGINVFGMKSKYKTACLEHSAAMPSLPPLDVLGGSLIGTAIWINYPHLTEAFVTAVSNETMTVRGKDTKPRRWSKKEAMAWAAQRQELVKEYERGQGFTGTGGLIVSENQDVILSVRPFKGLRTMPGGKTVKTFSKFEIEVPIVTALWAPIKADRRLSGVPALLEKDPYKYAGATRELSTKSGSKQNRKATKGEKQNQTAKATNNTPVEASSATGEEVSGEKTHWGSPFEDFSHLSTHSKPNGSKPKMNGSSEKTKRKSKDSDSLDILPLRPSHADAWLPLNDNVGEADSRGPDSSPLLSQNPPRGSSKHLSQTIDNAAASLPAQNKLVKASNKKWWEQPVYGKSSSRDFSTLQERPKQSVGSGNFGRRFPRSTKLSGHPRGRMLALGVAAAAFAYGSSVAQAGSTMGMPKHCRPTFSTIMQQKPGLFDLRGGSNSFLNEDENDDQRTPPALEFAHGTTTLSFVFQGGAIVAVDSRASLGNFVGSKTVQKVLPINSHILGTMAGGAADCSILMRKLMSEAQLHELREKRRMSTARVSRMLSNILYANRGLGLSVGTMILGFDDDDDLGGTNGTTAPSPPPKIFYVDNSGVRIPGDMFSAGSGSTFALAILDTERRYDMTEEEAISLGIKAIRHATFRDAFSGGFINVYLITRDGWRKVFTEDVAVTSEKIQQQDQ